MFCFFRWGVYDLTDAVKGIEHLISLNLVDEKKVLISGGSSGGYTTLACMTFRNTEDNKIFATGASYYGISDLSALAKDTHKFESHYCDSMIAEYPERKDYEYKWRSPLFNKEKFKTPCAFFQGKLDEVSNMRFSKRFPLFMCKNEISIIFG